MKSRRAQCSPAFFGVAKSATRRPHTWKNIIACRRRVNGCPHAGVLVVGFEPTRACAQRCVESLRLPVSPHQHLVGYEPRQSRRPRRDTSHVLPPATRQYVLTRTSVVPRTREPDHKPALLTPGASPGITRTWTQWIEGRDNVTARIRELAP